MNETLHAKLTKALRATHIEIIDNSWMHAGHMGNPNPHGASGTHLAITVVSPSFDGLSTLERHRLLHRLLKEEMSQQLHALELKTFSPAEWEKANAPV